MQPRCRRRRGGRRFQYVHDRFGRGQQRCRHGLFDCRCRCRGVHVVGRWGFCWRRWHRVSQPSLARRWLMVAVPIQALFGQLLIGLINGSFYALLSLGLAVIFGLLNIINFAHGAQYTLGAFCAYFLLNKAGVGYWPSLVIAPLAVGAFGMLIERTMLKH